MENHYIPFYFLMLMVAIYFTSSLVLRLCKGRLTKELQARDRQNTLDGLRGLAAMSVVMHHSLFFYSYIVLGKWSIDFISNQHVKVAIDFLGKGSVSVFFMITAFLFWGKLLGSESVINWRGFYVKRFFRILPLYLFVVVASFIYVIIVIKTPFSIFPYARDLFFWLTFDFLGTPNINGFPLSKSIVAGVFWTLSYEWLFYLALPMMSVFAQTKRSSRNILVSFFVLITLLTYFNVGIRLWTQVHILCFIIGAACAHVNKYHSELSSSLTDTKFSFIPVASVVIAVACFDAPYSYLPTILIGLSFLVISSGNSIFGFLKLKFMRFLGAISFSLYLLHGICYTVFFRPILNAHITYPTAVCMTVFIIIVVSTASYLLIERPFISRGRVIAEGTGGVAP